MRFGGEKDSITTSERIHFNVIKDLLKLRKSELCLQYGDCKVFAISPTVLVVERSYFNSKIQFIFNTGHQKLDLKDMMFDASTKQSFQSILTNGNEMPRELGGESFIVLKLN